MTEPNMLPDPSIELEEEAADWFARLHAGDATARDRAAFERWRAADPARELVYREIEATASLVQQGVATSSAQTRPPVASRRPLRAAWALAASVLLAAVIVQTWPGAPSNETIQTAVGETRRVQLADGSTVHLNGATTLVLHFSPQERGLELRQGQALFEVAKDAARPFRVDIGAAIVEAVGTQFDIDRRDGAIDVAVGEGVVALRSERDLSKEIAPALVPGQAVTLDAQGAAGPMRVVPVAQIAAWRRNMLFYDNVPFATVAAALMRHYPGAFSVGDKALAATRVSISINLQDRDSTLRAIELLLSVRAQNTPSGIVFYPARTSRG
jgi:transmembrane sensor